MSLEDCGLKEDTRFFLNGKDCLEGVLKIAHEAVASASIFPV